MTSALDRLASRLRRVERELLARKSPQLANSSIEDGALRVNAADGTEAMVIGKQFDGTQTTSVFNGPTPPTPTPAFLESVIGGLRIAVDGLFADGALVPMDFSRFEVHVSTNPAFEPDPTVTLKATIESPRGGDVYLALPYVPHSVRIVCRSQSGKGSAGSLAATATPGLVTVADVDLDLAPSDGVAPSTSPTVFVNPFAVGSLLASWGAIDNPDPVTYKVYVSTLPIDDIDYDIDLFAETTDTQIVIPPSRTYYGGPTYVRVIATDADGEAPISAQASGTPLRVDTDDVGDDIITAAHLTAGAVETDKLAANAVTADKIESNAVTTDKLDANAVTADKIAAGAVEADSIAAGAIDADKITANTITQRLLSLRPGGGSMVNIAPDAHFRDSFVNAARLAIANSINGTDTRGWDVRTVINLLPSSVASWTPGPKVASISSMVDDDRVPTSKQIFYTLNADAVAGDVMMTTTVPLTDLTRAIDMNCTGLDWQIEYLAASGGSVLRTDTGKYAAFYGSNNVFHATTPEHAAPPALTGSVRITLKAAQALTRLQDGTGPIQTYNAGAAVLWTTAGVGAEPGQGVFYWDVANPATFPSRNCTLIHGIPVVEDTPLDITVGFSCFDASDVAREFFAQANYESPDGVRLLASPQVSFSGRARSQMRFPAPPPGATQISLSVGNNSSPPPTRVEIYSVEVEYVSSITELTDVSKNAPTDGALLRWKASEGIWKPEASFTPFDVTVRQTVAQSVGQAVYSPDWTYLNFGVAEEIYGTAGGGGWSSLTPSRLELPAPGQYSFVAGWASTYASNVALDAIIGVRLYNSDGTVAKSSIAEDRVNRPYSLSATVSGSVKATAAGQYLRVYVFHDPGGTLNTVPDNCFLSVHRTS